MVIPCPTSIPDFRVKGLTNNVLSNIFRQHLKIRKCLGVNLVNIYLLLNIVWPNTFRDPEPLSVLHFIKLRTRDVWIFANYLWNISHCVHLSPPNRHRCAQMFLGQLSLWAHARRLHSKRRWLFSLTQVFSSSRSSWTTWKSKLLGKIF